MDLRLHGQKIYDLMYSKHHNISSFYLMVIKATMNCLPYYQKYIFELSVKLKFMLINFRSISSKKRKYRREIVAYYMHDKINNKYE